LLFCFDGFLLGVLGFCIGLIAYDNLVALGDWGRAVGFTIALIYFGLMDSDLSGGQTIGKWLADIKVVTAAGAPLSVSASMLRATIFCVPFFLNGAFIDTGPATSWLSELLVVVVFGVGLSIGYLLLFNRRTRQSLHDLAVGAYVVKNASRPIGDSQRVWAAHFAMVGLIVAAAAVLPYSTQGLARSATFAPLLSARQGLQQESNVRHVAVTVGVNRFASRTQGTTTTRILTSKIYLTRRITDPESLANQSARIILERDPSAGGEDAIEISIIYGYDIGIASAWKSQDFTFSPGEWRKRSTDSTNL
jgi:uncharacterized RDD family membrane protein YckC